MYKILYIKQFAWVLSIFTNFIDISAFFSYNINTQLLITISNLERSVANMPMVGRKSQATIIADYELLQELHEKWRNSKTLAGIKPMDARKYEVFNLPINSKCGTENIVLCFPQKTTQNRTISSKW